MVTQCPTCGRSNPSGNAYCVNCKTSLIPDQTLALVGGTVKNTPYGPLSNSNNTSRQETLVSGTGSGSQGSTKFAFPTSRTGTVVDLRLPQPLPPQKKAGRYTRFSLLAGISGLVALVIVLSA